MNKVYEFVAENLSTAEKRQIIDDYDHWAPSGVPGDSDTVANDALIRAAAYIMASEVYGEDRVCPSIRILMFELYVNVCRNLANKYLGRD